MSNPSPMIRALSIFPRVIFLARAKPLSASTRLNPEPLASIVICLACPPRLTELFIEFLTVALVAPGWALVPFDVDPSLRAGCPAACGEGGQFPARWEPCLGALLSPSTCIPPHAAQCLCPNVLLSPNAKVIPTREPPDPLQPSCRAMVLVRI